MQQDISFDDVTLDNQSDSRYALDHKLHLTFYTRPVINTYKSEVAKRNICDEVDYVIIHTPGSQLSTIDAPMSAGTYMTRFKDRYNKWKSGQAELVSGTPLESFPFMLGKVGLLAELKYLNIHTVEQLADLPDIHLQQIMGGNDLRNRAKLFVEGTSGTDAVLAQMQKENEQLKAQMENLTKMFGTKGQKDKVA